MAEVLARRQLTPELLDHLPASDPRAMGSRRDLVRINAIMFQAPIVARRLRRDVEQPPRRLLEIGCGDGALMLAVARRMARHWPGVELTLLDRQDLVPGERRRRFTELGWHAETVITDAIEWMEDSAPSSFDVITANLFLHHFAEGELRRLLAAAQRLAPVFIATEPRRNGVALVASGLLRLIGANEVTLHDAAASVRAGFADNELSALWPRGEAVIMREGAIGPFTHVFSARPAASGSPR